MKCIIERNCFFLKSVFKVMDCPEGNIDEIGFWGRSNVGKSSLLNCLTKTKIAKTSKTPGRTKSLNFFEVPNKIRLVDFPGYGFARVSKKDKKIWSNVITNYLDSRRNLICIFLLIDSRQGLMKIDLEAIDLLESFGNHFFVVFTKIDKVKFLELGILMNKTEKFLKSITAADKKIFMTSCKNGDGILDLKKKVINIVG